MIVLQTVAVAFSMFSALPMPQIEWNEKNMRWSLCAFPLVGAVIGLGCWGWLRLCAALSLPELLRGLQDYRMIIYSVILILTMILSNNEKVNAFAAGIRKKLAGNRTKEAAADE